MRFLRRESQFGCGRNEISNSRSAAQAIPAAFRYPIEGLNYDGDMRGLRTQRRPVSAAAL